MSNSNSAPLGAPLPSTLTPQRLPTPPAGTTVAALGYETKEGDFETVDLLYAGLPPQPPKSSSPGEWVALISGLQLGGSEQAELKGALLAEWLTGELGDDEDGGEAVRVTRLILAGNSLAQPGPDEADEKKPVSDRPGPIPWRVRGG